jgi:hypothetical protein
MYREQHMLVYRTEDAGKLVWNFTPKQAGWIGLGIYLTMTLVHSIPAIPRIGIWGYVFHAIPLILGLAFAYGKHTKTGMSLWNYVVSWVNVRRRKRVFTDF